MFEDINEARTIQMSIKSVMLSFQILQSKNKKFHLKIKIYI